MQNQNKEIKSYLSLQFQILTSPNLPIIKQTLENSKISDQMKDALGKVKYISCKPQAPNIIQKFFFSLIIQVW